MYMSVWDLTDFYKLDITDPCCTQRWELVWYRWSPEGVWKEIMEVNTWIQKVGCDKRLSNIIRARR
jgi:hypothetical protein